MTLADTMMNALKTIGRSGAIFGLLIVTLIAGTFLTSFLPSPPGRYIFTPANEIGAGAMLLLVSWAIAFWKWPRPLDLLLAWITSQLVVVLIVALFTGFSSIFLWWVIHISRFITPTIALGMIVGLTMRVRRRNRNGQPAPSPYGSPGTGSPSGEASRSPTPPGPLTPQGEGTNLPRGARRRLRQGDLHPVECRRVWWIVVGE